MKKDKDEILTISNFYQLGLCIEDKKSDMVDSILEKKKLINIENQTKIKKKKYSLN